MSSSLYRSLRDSVGDRSHSPLGMSLPPTNWLTSNDLDLKERRESSKFASAPRFLIPSVEPFPVRSNPTKDHTSQYPDKQPLHEDQLVEEDDTSGLMSMQASMQADEAAQKLMRQSDPSVGPKLLMAGAFAGAISKTATAPLARITILNQVQGASSSSPSASMASVRSLGVVETMRTIVRREGLTALWKGNGVTLVHRFPYSATNFYVYELSRKALKERRDRGLAPDGPSTSSDAGVIQSMSDRLISGAIAGSTAVTLAYPLDLVRTRLAAQGEQRYYRGIWHALRTIVRDEGLVGLYRGLGATILGTGPNIALNYTLYETFKSLACRLQYRVLAPSTARGGPEAADAAKPSVLVSLGCGSLSGVVSTTLTYPLDLVRRRIQMGGVRIQQPAAVGGPGSASFAPATAPLGYWPSVQAIWRAEGVRGFYHGIRPEYLKVVPGVAIAFGTYELLKRAMGVETVIDHGAAGAAGAASKSRSKGLGVPGSARGVDSRT